MIGAENLSTGFSHDYYTGMKWIKTLNLLIHLPFFNLTNCTYYIFQQECYWMTVKYLSTSILEKNQVLDFVDIQNLICNTFLYNSKEQLRYYVFVLMPLFFPNQQIEETFFLVVLTLVHLVLQFSIKNTLDIICCVQYINFNDNIMST